MKQKYLYSLLITGIVVCTSGRSTEAQDQPPGDKAMLGTSVETELGREESFRVETTAKIEKIDHETREVTLRTADNDTVKFTAGPEVQRLNEMKAGDTVAASYVATLAFEVRPPTTEELANPTSSVAVAARAPQDEAPGAASVQGVHTIVTITELDKTAKTVTVKTPAGKLFTVKAKNEERFDTLKVGDTVAVTYAEGIDISIVR